MMYSVCVCVIYIILYTYLKSHYLSESSQSRTLQNMNLCRKHVPSSFTWWLRDRALPEYVECHKHDSVAHTARLADKLS